MKKKKKPPTSAGKGNNAASGFVSITIKDHKDAKGGHPHIIIEDLENKHVSVGLSTKPKKGRNSPNYKLEMSPLGDGKQSYVRRQGTVEMKKNYEKPRTGKMTPNDYVRVKEYGKKAKQKYLEKAKKK